MPIPPLLANEACPAGSAVEAAARGTAAAGRMSTEDTVKRISFTSRAGEGGRRISSSSSSGAVRTAASIEAMLSWTLSSPACSAGPPQPSVGL
eukprot:scaffold40437_cov28-Tisochrysis_lutea.AAC.2